MSKIVTIPLLALLLLPALPASAQSDRKFDRGLEEKLEMILERLERLEQHAKRADRGPERRHEERRHDERRGNVRRGEQGRRTEQGHRNGQGHRNDFRFGGPRDLRAAQMGPQALGKLPEIMKAAMQGDPRAQKMLAMLHKKIGGVLKASKNSTMKTKNVDIRRHKVMAVEVDRRRVEVELAHRDLKRREMALKQGEQKRYKVIVTDGEKKPAQKKARRAKKATGSSIERSDIDRMRELTKKSRQLQEEIRRLRAELAQQK